MNSQYAITGGIARKTTDGRMVLWSVEAGWVDDLRNATLFDSLEDAQKAAPNVAGLAIATAEDLQNGNVIASLKPPSLADCPADVAATLSRLPTNWESNCLLWDAVICKDWTLILSYCKAIASPAYLNRRDFAYRLENRRDKKRARRLAAKGQGSTCA